MLGLVLVAQRGQSVLLRPGLELVRVDLRRSGRADRVMHVGEGAVVAVLGLQALQRFEEFVALERNIDLKHLFRELLQLPRDHTAAVVLADARAPELLEALPLQPQQVGLQASPGRGPVATHHLGFARPERGTGIDEALDVGDTHGVDPKIIAEIRSWVSAAERVVALTGAGISTDSGIPDFRGPQGVWTRSPEAEKMATLENYLADREVRKRAWRNRLDTPHLGAEPNAGHHALVALERRGKLDTLITQNVDGLHIKAGASPQRVIEIHGHTREVVCLECGERAAMERALARVRAGEDDPPCRSCGGILKAATISFGQALVADVIDRAFEAARGCDLILAVGTKLSVYPIAGVVPVAKEAGARVVILNSEPTEMDGLADVVVRGPISAILPRLVEE